MDWASLDFENIANAIVILLVGIVGVFGYRSGSRRVRARSDEYGVEGAASLFDPSSIDKLTAEITGHAVAMTRHTVAFKDVNATFQDMTRAVHDLQRELHEFRDEVARHRR